VVQALRGHPKEYGVKDTGGTRQAYWHEILLDQKLDKRNFRKNVSKDILIIKTDEKQKGVAHKPAHLYTYKNREN